jgi:hypothetical protein
MIPLINHLWNSRNIMRVGITVRFEKASTEVQSYGPNSSCMEASAN